MPLSERDRELAFRGYVECALWTSDDESEDLGGEPLDRNYTVADLAPESLEAMTADLTRFLELAGTDVDKLLGGHPWALPDASYIGHNLWLTQNHHGTGYWDRGFPKDLGDRLTKAAESIGEAYLRPDDGTVYLERG